MNTKSLPLVSVVITTKNEEKNIGNCLESIKHQTYPQKKIEIIVVDNNSVDKTKEIAKKFTTKVFNKGPERSTQRNFGMIDKAKGKYVMYLDADFVLEKDLIRECVEKTENYKKTIALYVPLRWVGKGWIVKAKGFEREFYDTTRLDAARFIKKDVFVKIGGFDERLYAGEDWDLDKRIRGVGRIGVVKSKIYHHEDMDINLKKYLKKMNYYASNIMIYTQKYDKSDPDIKKQLGFQYRYFEVFFEDGKWKKLLRHPVLAGGMYFLKFIVGVQYLKTKIKVNQINKKTGNNEGIWCF